MDRWADRGTRWGDTLSPPTDIFPAIHQLGEVVVNEQQSVLSRQMDLRPILATNMRRLRGAKGLTQARLAERAGVDRVIISRIETGSTYAGLKVIGKLAEALNANATELFLQRGSPITGRLRR